MAYGCVSALCESSVFQPDIFKSAMITVRAVMEHCFQAINFGACSAWIVFIGVFSRRSTLCQSLIVLCVRVCVCAHIDVLELKQGVGGRGCEAVRRFETAVFSQKQQTHNWHLSLMY